MSDEPFVPFEGKPSGGYPQGGYQKKPYQNNNYGNKNYNNGGNGNKQFFKKKPPEPLPTTLYKPYIATGNKEVPENIKEQLKSLVKKLEGLGYTLRTGVLEGVEEALETTSSNSEIYIPWRGFKEKEHKFNYNTPQSLEIAKLYHPTFDGLPKAVQAFLGKNVRMIMGEKLKSPGLFLICWSEDGAEKTSERSSRTGNVFHAISIANALKIPVFNFGKPDAEQRLINYLGITNGYQESSTKEIDSKTQSSSSNFDF